MTFLGDGVTVFHDYIEDNCQVQHDYAPAHMNKQRQVLWHGWVFSMQKKASLRLRQNTVRIICVCPRQSGSVRKCWKSSMPGHKMSAVSENRINDKENEWNCDTGKTKRIKERKNMAVREMQPEDVPSVAALEAECFSEPWSEQAFLDA